MTEMKNYEQTSNALLQPGEKAPDFELKSISDKVVSPHDFLGKPVVLVFYPADWSPVCTDQLALYNELLPEFKKYNAEILGISVDSSWSHKAFAKDRNLHFQLLSDFEPKGEVARKYKVYDSKKGRAERALYVIDPEGNIFWAYLSPSGENPGADGILTALDHLKIQEKKHA